MRDAVDQSYRIAYGKQPTPPQAVSLPSLAGKLTASRMVAALWVAAALNLAFVFARLPAHENTIDFSLYYTAATALRVGVSPYTGDLEPLAHKLGLHIDKQIRLPFTPPFLLAFEPLTLLSSGTAYLIWLALNLIALGVSIFLLLRRPRRAALSLGALVALYPPLTDELLFAQSQLLVLLLLCLMLYYLDTNNDAAAGIALGIAGALRVYPLAMLGYLVLKCRWRAIFFTGLTLVVVGAATVALLGWRACSDFPSGARYALGYRFLALPTNISLNGFVSRFFWNVFSPNLDHSLDLLRHLAILMAELVVLALSMRATLLSSGSRAFSLWIATAIIVSPSAWFHYMILLCILFSEVATAVYEGTCSVRAVWAAVLSYVSAFVVNDIMLGFTTRYSLFYRWFGQFYFLSTLLAYLSAYWLATDRGELACRANLRDSARPAAHA